MKTIYALIASGLAVITSNPAFAQSADAASETPAQAFSGAHAEATFGWDHLSQKSLKDNDQAAYSKGSANGVTYGAAVGYDIAVTPHVTLGAELGLYGNSGRWNNTNLAAGTFNTASVNPGRDAFAGARIGYALTPKTQVFAKGGYVNSHFGVTGENGTDTLHDGFNASGYRLGAGIEQKLTRATYVKLEYDYSHYGSGQFDYYGNATAGGDFDLHSNRSQVLASVGLRFR